MAAETELFSVAVVAEFVAESVGSPILMLPIALDHTTQEPRVRNPLTSFSPIPKQTLGSFVHKARASPNLKLYYLNAAVQAELRRNAGEVSEQLETSGQKFAWALLKGGHFWQ